MVLAGELRELLDHDRSRRHVDPDGERLGGEDDLDQPFDETGLDDLLHRRHHARVVSGDPALQLCDELSEAEDVQVGVVEAAEASIDDPRDRGAFVTGGQIEPCIDTRLGRRIALRSAEDEEDRRQETP